MILKYLGGPLDGAETDLTDEYWHISMKIQPDRVYRIINRVRNVRAVLYESDSQPMGSIAPVVLQVRFAQYVNEEDIKRDPK